jgi:hypothetical protein
MHSGKEILFIDAAYSPVESAVGNDLRVYITAPNREQPTEILGDFVRMGGWRWVAAHPDGRISFYGFQRDRGIGFFTVSRDGKNLVDADYAPEVPSVLRDQNWQIRRFRWNEAGNLLVPGGRHQRSAQSLASGRRPAHATLAFGGAIDHRQQ